MFKIGIELNNGQQQAVKALTKWYKSQYKPTFEISGPAGSGKTTLVYSLIEALDLKLNNVLFVAYTGKATLELSLKKCFAKTIHSAFYDYEEVVKTDEHGKIIYELGLPVKRKQFVKKQYLDPKVKIIVVDEASMIPYKMREDILSFNIPVIALGDLDQLPPIYGNPAFLKEPDVILKEIMRQNKDNPIIYLSDLARKNKYIHHGKYGNNCYVIKKDEITNNMLKNVDMVICGKNRTRHELNSHIREYIYKHKTNLPSKGDKIICRRNNWNESIDNGKYPLINGMIGFITDDVSMDKYDYSNNTVSINFRPEFSKNKYFDDLPIDYSYLNDDSQNKNQLTKYRYSSGEKFEYGYAITGHLSQGSQYGSILVYNEYLGGNIYNKWLYTVLTRPTDFLILAK